MQATLLSTCITLEQKFRYLSILRTLAADDLKVHLPATDYSQSHSK